MALSFELRSFHPSLPERDLYLQANINTSEGKETRQGRGLHSNLKLSLGRGKCKWWKQMIYQGKWLPVELLVPLQMTSGFCFWTSGTIMLPRSMKTSGVDLPGVGPREVPLIGYRPLQPEVDGPPDQLWKENENREADHTQVRWQWCHDSLLIIIHMLY